MFKVYSKAHCIGCTATKKHFDKLGVEYEEINVTDNPQVVDELVAKGYKSLPVVVAPTGYVWSGYQPEEINKAIKESGKK